MKVGTKVWSVKISNHHNAKYSYQKDGVEIEECKVIGISHYRICVNSGFFQTFSKTVKGKKKESHNQYLNDIRVSIRTKDSLFSDGVFIEQWTTVKPTSKTLDKMVAKAAVKIDDDYGFLFQGVKDQLYELANMHQFS